MREWKPFEHHYFECQCDSREHTLRFIFDPNDQNDSNLWTEVYLWPYTFWKRVWIGLKYIAGYQGKYGSWDCTLLRREDYPRLRDLLDRSEAEYVKHDKLCELKNKAREIKP